MDFKIAVIPGDGIGQEIMTETLKVLDKVGEKYGHNFNYTTVLAGGAAIDATGALRPGNVTLADFFHQIKEKYPVQKLMADCSTIEEAFFADELGFDFIGTTMVGYTPQSRGMKIEANDFEILRTILKKVKHPVIAEGNVNSPEKAKRVIELGSYAVVVGSSITRPQLITKGYAEAVDSAEK